MVAILPLNDGADRITMRTVMNMTITMNANPLSSKKFLGLCVPRAEDVGCVSFFENLSPAVSLEAVDSGGPCPISNSARTFW